MSDLKRFFRKKGFPVLHLPEDRPHLELHQMNDLATVFIRKLFAHKILAGALRRTCLSVGCCFFDEKWGEDEFTLTIACSPEKLCYFLGECDINPKVILKCHGDTAHRFWRKKLNLLSAIATRKIQVKGPLPELLKLLPLAPIGFKLYRETLEELGYTDLLNYP